MVSKDTSTSEITGMNHKKGKTGRYQSEQSRGMNGFAQGAGKTVLALISMALCAAILAGVLLFFGGGSASSVRGITGAAIMDKFDMFMTNEVSNALQGILNIEKVYWLSDSDLVAPKPDPAAYGTADSPAELAWLLEEAKELIGDRKMIFNTNTEIRPGSKIHYYYDETILVITWKNKHGAVPYSYAETIVAHPSQFRRFLADGEFGSDKQYVTTHLAKEVNSVMATSGDFYKHRYYGVVVHEGQIERAEFNTVDTCFIDDQSTLLFSPKGAFKSLEEAQKFVDDNNIRFSLAFGPILVWDGVECTPDDYAVGEINDPYTRAAICQQNELHYLIVNTTGEFKEYNRHTMREFAIELQKMGCRNAYALDGGQTTVITMDGELVTNPDHGDQRKISDIIYFATALPNGE